MNIDLLVLAKPPLPNWPYNPNRNLFDFWVICPYADEFAPKRAEQIQVRVSVVIDAGPIAARWRSGEGLDNLWARAKHPQGHKPQSQSHFSVRTWAGDLPTAELFLLLQLVPEMMPGKVRSSTWMLLIDHAVKDEVIISKFLGAISASIERLAERAQRVLDDRPVLRSGHAGDIITGISTSPRSSPRRGGGVGTGTSCLVRIRWLALCPIRVQSRRVEHVCAGHDAAGRVCNTCWLAASAGMP